MIITLLRTVATGVAPMPPSHLLILLLLMDSIMDGRLATSTSAAGIFRPSCNNIITSGLSAITLPTVDVVIVVVQLMRMIIHVLALLPV